jgi:hypothetical protein
MDADRRSILSAVDHEMSLTRREIVTFSGLTGVGVLLATIGFQIGEGDALSATIKRAGGTPVEPKKMSDYAWPRLASQADVLIFAAKLEAGAASAYLGALRAIENKEYLTAAASIMGNETQHLALLRQVLKENPVPVAFIG